MKGLTSIYRCQLPGLKVTFSRFLPLQSWDGEDAAQMGPWGPTAVEALDTTEINSSEQGRFLHSTVASTGQKDSQGHMFPFDLVCDVLLHHPNMPSGSQAAQQYTLLLTMQNPTLILDPLKHHKHMCQHRNGGCEEKQWSNKEKEEGNHPHDPNMCQCCVKIFLGLKTGSDRLKTKHDKIHWSMSMSNSMGHVLRNRWKGQRGNGKESSSDKSPLQGGQNQRWCQGKAWENGKGPPSVADRCLS